MEALDLARWQFGIITVYHFLFVPLTIGLAPIVAGLEAAWIRTGKVHYLRAARFWSKLFLINFAIGVATGIVQELQFGMNWSNYSRFVGDIFGAPLAMEGLLAFFIESTFLGLWIFGWDRLSPTVHNLCMWMVSFGTLLSAYFILAANSWMQHPVGYEINEQGQARLTSIWAVLTNSTQLVTFPHVVFASLITAGIVVTGVSAWHVRRQRNEEVFRPSLKLGMVIALLASIGVAITGDLQSRLMEDQQPMKMAAAEALYETTDGAPFSILTVGDLDGSEPILQIRVPNLLSLIATNSPHGTVAGINDLQEQYVQQFGPGDYIPNIPVSYWGFRLMIGFGALAALAALAGLWATRGGRSPSSRWFWRLGIASIALPFLANTFGWIFTEMGRQPWAVFGLLTTSDSVSPTVSWGEVLTGLTAYTVLYLILAVIELKLMWQFARADPMTEEQALALVRRGPGGPGGLGRPDGGLGRPDGDDGADSDGSGDRPLVFAY